MTQSLPTRVCLAVTVALAVAALPTVAHANHAWGCYHWARANNPVSLTVGDNVDGTWDAYLDGAIADWDVNRSGVLDLSKVAGAAKGRNCRPGTGKIEVCNNTYGNNGWLGIAQIWVSGCHITAASTRVNDTYFNTSTYNTAPWRRMVMCQEIGHDFGLTHQDETFDNANLGSCMDYTNDPDGGAGGAVSNDPSNEHPNAHDYEELGIIYAHSDSGAAPSANANAPEEWGRLVASHAGGRVQDFERDLGHGEKMITRVVWAK